MAVALFRCGGTMGQDAFIDTTTPTLDEVVRAIEARIEEILERARQIRSLGISPELLDELLALRFRKSRLESRLDSLLDGGLLALSVRRAQCPVEIVAKALDEIEKECSRIGVTVHAELIPTSPLRIDGNQIAEAIRGILEDLLDGLTEGTELRVTARPDAGDSVEVRFEHQGALVVPTLASSGVAYLLANDPWSGLELASTSEPTGLRVMVRRPPDVVPKTTRYWLFPAPTAA